MLLFIAGLVIFLGVHSIAIVAPAWRDAQLAQRGEAVWKGLYSVVSILGFALLIHASENRSGPRITSRPLYVSGRADGAHRHPDRC